MACRPALPDPPVNTILMVKSRGSSDTTLSSGLWLYMLTVSCLFGPAILMDLHSAPLVVSMLDPHRHVQSGGPSGGRYGVLLPPPWSAYPPRCSPLGVLQSDRALRVMDRLEKLVYISRSHDIKGRVTRIRIRGRETFDSLFARQHTKHPVPPPLHPMTRAELHLEPCSPAPSLTIRLDLLWAALIHRPPSPTLQTKGWEGLPRRPHPV